MFYVVVFLCWDFVCFIEVGMKYFVFGVLFFGLFLYGFLLVYGFVGIMNFVGII